jgi:hypothetical protein
MAAEAEVMVAAVEATSGAAIAVAILEARQVITDIHLPAAMFPGLP